MKLSIITINLNNRDGLIKTIESVVCQIYTDYEYIVVDGGSTDGSVDIIKQHADKITYWVSEPDKGIYNAMNKGILKAKGEYCLFLNSGDWLIAPEVISNVLEMEYGNKDLLICRLHRRHAHIKGLISRYDNSLIRFSDFYVASLPHMSTFIKRDLFNEIGLYNENNKIVSDWEFFLLAVVKFGVSYCFIDYEIADIQDGGISSSMLELMGKERSKCLKIYFPSFVDDYKEYLDYKKSRTINRIKKIIDWKSGF